ncbi:MAG: metallophosphoesterase [Thermodesulfobacteriota bacterium]
MKIAHLSDLHFGRRVSAEKTDALYRDLRALRPDLLVLTGDVTDRGTRGQFRLALAFLESVAVPFLSVPGNREVCISSVWEWTLPTMAMTRYRHYFGRHDRVVFQSETEKVVFFGLNSVHSFPSWPGSIARETRYWFREQSARYSDHVKVLFLHHPVLPVIRGSSFWAHTLSDAGELLNICTENGVSLILQGHKHRSAVVELFVPERNARLLVAAGGAPLMPYWDPSYHLVEIAGRTMKISTREFQAGRFAQKYAYESTLE